MNLTDKQKFLQRQSLPLEDKIQMTMQRIKAWYKFWEEHDESIEDESKVPEFPVYGAYSGGKDSHVFGEILQMMGKPYSDIPLVFSNTGLEMPEIVKHVRNMQKVRGWNIEEIRPPMTYNKVWEEEGIPIVSKKVARQIRTLKAGPTGNGYTYRLYSEGINRDGVAAPNWKISEKWRFLVERDDIKTSEKCCDRLKKDPIKLFERKHKMKGRGMRAIMADEGGYRRGMTKCNVFSGKTTSSQPMLFWTEEDIWEFIEKYNVEICEVYYNRLYNEDGCLVACDAPHSNLPTLREFTINHARLNCVNWDDKNQDGFKGLGGYAFFQDLDDNNKEYAYIRGEYRTGCMFCAFGAHLEKGSNRFQRMSISHPRQHRIIMDRLGMAKVLDVIGVKTTFDK